MNNLLAFLSNPQVKDVSFAAFTIFILVSVFTGLLIPYRTHKREIADLKAWGEAWHQAHTVSEKARSEQAIENFRLSETIRLAGIKPIAEIAPSGGV